MKTHQQIKYSPCAYTPGFTLVETLVSVSILLVVIIGPMTIARQGMRMGFHANEQMTAVFLAEEALESVIALRDDNALNVLYNGGADTWSWYGNAGISSCKAVNGCDLDTEDGTYHACSSNGSGCILKKSVLPNKAYDYSGLDASPYIRQIFLSNPIVVGPDTIATKVTVTVKWSVPTYLLSSGTRTITLQTYIYDHYAHFE